MSNRPTPAHRRRLGATSGLAALLLAAPLAAMPTAASAAPGAWGADAEVSATLGVAPNEPHLVTANDGSVTAVWRHNDDSQDRIVTATKPGGSRTWGAARVLTPTVEADCFAPSVASAPNGQTTAAWTCGDSSNAFVQVATRAAGASTWGAPLTVSGPDLTVDAYYPAELAVGTDGTSALSWSQVDGTRNRTAVAIRAAGATTWRTEFVSAASDDAWSNTVGVAPNGDVTAAWELEDGGAYPLTTRTKLKGASTWGAPVVATAPASEGGWWPRLGFAANGTATLVWETYDGNRDLIVAAQRTAGTTAWTTPTILSAGADTSDHVLAVAPNGTAVTAWTADDGNYPRIEAAHLVNGVWGQPVAVSAASYTHTADAFGPALSGGADGTFALAWARDDGDVDRAETSSWSASTGRWSKVTPLSKSVDENVEKVQISVAADGATTAIWKQHTGLTSSLFAASTALPKPVLKVTTKGSATTGATLTCAVGAVHATDVPALGWTRGGVAIKGATKSSYTLTGADFGKKVACRATATNAAGSSAVSSAAVTVKAGTIKALTKPKVTGKAKVGKKLKASTGAWSVKGTKAGYQWFRGTKAIKGKAAKKATYKVVAKDKGKKLRVKVTVTAQGYQSASATSKTTKKVKK